MRQITFYVRMARRINLAPLRNLRNYSIAPEKHWNQGYSSIKLSHQEDCDLITKQILLEEQQEYQASSEKEEIMKELVRMGKGSSQKSIHLAIKKWYDPFTAALEDELRAIYENPVSVEHTRYGHLLLNLKADKLAMVTLDKAISSILQSGNSGVPVANLLVNIGSLVETEFNLALLSKSKDSKISFRFKSLKRNYRDSKKLYQKLLQTELEMVEEWDNDMRIKIGALLIKIMMNSIKDENNERIFVYDESAAGRKNVKKSKLIKLSAFSYSSLHKLTVVQPRYLPMLIPPRPWNNKGYEGPYLLLKPAIMKYLNKGQMQAVKNAQMKDVLLGLNYLGSTAWKINSKVYNVINEVIQEKSIYSVGGLPASDDLKLLDLEEFLALDKSVQSVRPSSDDERKNLQRSYYSYKTRIEKKNSELHSLRCDMKLKLSIAEQFLYTDRIYFPHNLDFRGRVYPVPPNLNHIGSDFCRGLLTFADPKLIGQKGFKWMKIHLANLFGNNKISLEEREAWTESQKNVIIEIAREPTGSFKKFWMESESPFQALATCFELANAWRLANPAEYCSSLPIHQDGSCNGLQHYAALGRDLEGGIAVNLVDGSAPSDVYSRVLDLVRKRLEADCSNLESQNAKRTNLASRLIGLINRKVIKQTVMTSVYGVTRIGAREQVQARLVEMIQKEGEVLSRDEEQEIYEAANYLAAVTLESIGTLFSSAKKIMDWLADVSKIVAEQGQAMSWITPLGLPVMQPYRREQQYSLKTVLQNFTLTLDSDLLPVSSQKQKSAFPPNFVHSLDSTHMLLTCLKMKERGLCFASVHDSFWTHASDVDELNQILRAAFIQLYQRPILEELREQLELRFPKVRFPDIPQTGGLDLNLVHKSRYFFH